MDVELVDSVSVSMSAVEVPSVVEASMVGAVASVDVDTISLVVGSLTGEVEVATLDVAAEISGNGEEYERSPASGPTPTEYSFSLSWNVIWYPSPLGAS